MTYPWAAGEVLTAADLNAFAGLVYITKGTATTTTSLQLEGCFSSSFDNYRITVSATAVTSDADVTFQLVSSTTPATGANYSTATWGLVWGSSFSGSGSTGNTSGTCGRLSSTGLGGFAFDLYNPQKASYTFAVSSYTDNVVARHSQVRHALSTAYDGIKVMTSANATFTVRVYGYNNG